MNVVPAQVAGVRSIALVQPAAEEQRRPARADDPGRVRAARRRRGVRRRRRPGDRDVRLRRRARARRSTSSPVPATSTSPPPSGCCAASVGIDSEAGPTEIAILADDTRRRGVRRRRPDQPGRARPDGRVRAGHRLRSRWPTTSRPSSTSRSSRPGTPSGSSTALGGQQSGDRAGRRHRPGPRRGQRLRRRAPRDPHPRRRRASPPGCATPARSSSARGRRCRSATTAPAPTTCCRPPAAPATPAGCRCARSSSRCTSSTTPATALAEVADHVVTLAEAEDLPGHGAAVSVRFDAATMSAIVPAPARGAARDRALRRAPALDRRRSSSTSTRTPTAPRPRRRPTSPRAVGEAAATLNRYPDREFTALREALAAYLNTSGGTASRPTWCGRPTAPTR